MHGLKLLCTCFSEETCSEAECRRGFTQVGRLYLVNHHLNPRTSLGLRLATRFCAPSFFFEGLLLIFFCRDCASPSCLLSFKLPRGAALT